MLIFVHSGVRRGVGLRVCNMHEFSDENPCFASTRSVRANICASWCESWRRSARMQHACVLQ